MLDRLGYDAVVVSVADQALSTYAEAMRSGSPFLAVVVDLTLDSGRSGLDVMNDLRKLDPAVRGIVCSGRPSQILDEACKAAGFRSALPKPFRPSDVAQCLDEALGKVS